ncbi:MAG: GntG family PLP-dependent aldolase [Planctomycetota bacterium]|nr:GntG family PLP-dependent aldolase [Planctomycetota bacterium]
MPSIIDLRSDTVTRPTPEMRRAMAAAEVGDDVLGDDPTVIRLQEMVAEMMGKEAACFVPSGTMANQTAIRAHCEPGDEIICHKDSHIIHYETGSPAALSGVMIRGLEGDRGLFTPQAVEEAVRPVSSHFARSRLVIVENTHNRGGGTIWPLEQLASVAAITRKHGLRVHLDGARLWNACAATGLAPREYAQHFDTVSCCFSKGLGAPVGSAVAGGKEIITRVHRFRKMFGGTMRQSGIVAAAAIHSLQHHRERLVEDHANAKRLAAGLAEIKGLVVDAAGVETNMVFFDLHASLPWDSAGFCTAMRERGVWMLANGPRRVRTVCHLDVNAEMIDEGVRRIREAVSEVRPRLASVV